MCTLRGVTEACTVLLVLQHLRVHNDTVQVRLQRPRAVMGASLALPKVMGAAARSQASRACPSHMQHCCKAAGANASLLCAGGSCAETLRPLEVEGGR